MPLDSRQRALAIAQIATGLGILTFWTLFLAVGMAPKQPPPCYFAFEHAFPVPDTVLAIGLLVSGFRRETAWAQTISLACGGALLFLGVLDLSFAIQSGLLAGPIADALQSAAIALWCGVLGLGIIASRLFA